MDDSASIVNSRLTNTTAASQNWVMGRAIASAAIFGFIGKSIGRWLGKQLNNDVVESTLKWSMGTFWAVLAAYSSLKASAIASGEVVKESAEKPVVTADKKIPEVNDAKIKTPLSLIELDTLKDQGTVVSAPQLQRS